MPTNNSDWWLTTAPDAADKAEAIRIARARDELTLVRQWLIELYCLTQLEKSNVQQSAT